MDETSKKSLFDQKLSDPTTTLESLMAHDTFLENFRSANPQLLSFLKTSHYKKLITFVTVVGPQSDKLRSYQYPQLACDVFLTTQTPIVTDILFTPNSEAKNSQLIYDILDYFKTTPNYVLSGYVIKIIGNLYFSHPFKIQEFVIKGGYALLMLKFLQSKSVAEFLIRLIVIEDQNLLNCYFQERRQLLNQVIKLYTNKDTDNQQKSQLCFILIDALNRLWANKHKQSGRFAPQIFKIVQVALNSQNQAYPDHQNLISIVMKNICNHTDVAPFLIKKLTKKILQELNNFQAVFLPSSYNKQIPKFTQKNHKFLIGLTYIMNHIPIIEDLLSNNNIFGLLLKLMEQFQWNNLLHVEIQKIFKSALESHSEVIYNNIFIKGEFVSRTTSMIKSIKSQSKFGKGYTGCLTNILVHINHIIKKQTYLGKLIKANNPKLQQEIEQYIEPKINLQTINLGGYKLNNEFAKAKYEENKLFEKYQIFLNNLPQTEALVSNISSSLTNSQALEEMENEGVLNQHLVQEEGEKQVKEQIMI